jgi:DNA-binding PadR family transcriptional regulator
MTSPLTQAGYLILLALAPGPTHGYRIMQVINDIFRTELKIGPGTLYRTLQRLTLDGLIAEVETEEEDKAAESDRRKAYRLTSAGGRAATEETRRLDVLVRLAKIQLADGPA